MGKSGAIWCTLCGQNQGFKYTDEHIPTEKLGGPTAPPQRCECGSGSNEASGAHSHWCPRWVRP